MTPYVFEPRLERATTLPSSYYTDPLLKVYVDNYLEGYHIPIVHPSAEGRRQKAVHRRPLFTFTLHPSPFTLLSSPFTLLSS